MTVFEWLEETSTRGRKKYEREQLSELRNRVCARAKVKMCVLTSSKSRGTIGKDLTRRMAFATRNEKLKIDFFDEFL